MEISIERSPHTEVPPWGSNSQPLDSELDSLTTRPQLRREGYTMSIISSRGHTLVTWCIMELALRGHQLNLSTRDVRP